MSENKTQPTAISPEEYVANVEHDGRRADSQVLMQLMQRLTGEKPKMWGPTMVGFGSYHYVYESGREGDMFLAGFAPRKSELAIYLIGKIPDQADLLAKLGKHKMGKSCLYVKRLEQIDMDVLEELIVKSIAAIKAQYPS